MWCHLVAKFGPNASGAKFATKASGTIWWPKLQLMQMSPSGGQFWNQCKLHYMLAKFGTDAGVATWLSFLAGEISQVKESVPWVRCASGNAMHNVYIGQFFFPSTERAQTYLKISVLTNHSTYICPNSLG